MRTSPLIGLTTTLPASKASGPLADRIQAYVRAIERANGLPLLVPYGLDEGTRRALYRRLDGLLLTGGGDVAPQHYGQAPFEGLHSLDTARDETELELARWAAAEGKPLLAICRGLQVINVAAGGTLYQDLPSQRPGPIRHDADDQPSEQPVHTVTVSEGSALAACLGATVLQVNSAHHQAIDRVGRGLRLTAFAPDGVVEGAELEGHPCYLGVQWHPERLPAEDRSAALFVHLIAAALHASG